MSAVVGERDRLLRGTVPRNINPTAGKSLLLDVDPPAFHQNSAGTPTITSAKFTATPVGFAGTVMWSITSGGKLTGTTPNERTLLFSDMTADTVKVTVTFVYQGEAFIRVRTFYKIIDGARGQDGTPADLSPANLVAALEGRITDSMLYTDLRTRIDLVDGPSSNPSTVQGRIKKETDARVIALGAEAQARADAIDKEVADRIAAVLAEAGARATYVQTYTFSQQQINSALSIQATQIAAAYTAYADTARTQAVTTADANMRAYGYSFADANGAIAAAENRLRAEFVSSSGATEAYVQGWSFSKADSLAAEANQTSTLTASLQSYADQKKSEAKADAAADVRSYALGKVDATQAEAAQTNTITANYKGYADSARDQAVSTSNAFVQTYAYGKTTIDNSLSTLANTLRSEFAATNGVTTGYLNQYYYTSAQTNTAISNATQTLSTTVGQHTTTLQTQSQSLDGLSGQLTWKIDNNGHVSGFGLASTPINGVPYSTMIFNVDVLGVALPGGAGKPIFTVGQVNGQSQAVFRSDLFVDGAITARMLKIGTSDNIIPDPAFRDLAWWGRLGFTVDDYSAGGTFWKSGYALKIQAANGNGAPLDTLTGWFPMTPGATYLVEFQAFVSGDFVGSVTPFWHIPNVQFHLMGGPTRGYNWGDGLPVGFDQNSAKGLQSFTATYTVPINGYTSRSQIRIKSQCSAGSLQLGGFSITRVSDSVLIADGAVTANKLNVGRVGNVGAGVEIDKDGERVYDANNLKRFQSGNLDV
ncbi:hypothetical protein [Massilia sp. S19_KUP03_FR1]|uniref:hypothetical protein n=1 Tax=Massilia sp. S19_KUP03_FR1 TaxID=3025503 RepID=UPI002FCCE69F